MTIYFLHNKGWDFYARTFEEHQHRRCIWLSEKNKSAVHDIVGTAVETLLTARRDRADRMLCWRPYRRWPLVPAVWIGGIDPVQLNAASKGRLVRFAGD